ncbi:hypothetical protein [Thioclava sp. GXIMD2076]|uniref:hypothetical protein n=1 Tax=Thioclava sp. GXIMD2076 TaxID=3131931 RepID=UPI0030D4E97C
MRISKMLRNRDLPFSPVRLQIACYRACLPFGSLAPDFTARMTLRITISGASVAAVASLSWLVLRPTCAEPVEACLAHSSLPNVWIGIGCTGALLCILFGTLVAPCAQSLKLSPALLRHGRRHRNTARILADLYARAGADAQAIHWRARSRASNHTSH